MFYVYFASDKCQRHQFQFNFHFSLGVNETFFCKNVSLSLSYSKRLHLPDKKYSKNSNIVKYYHNLK